MNGTSTSAGDSNNEHYHSEYTSMLSSSSSSSSSLSRLYPNDNNDSSGSDDSSCTTTGTNNNNSSSSGSSSSSRSSSSSSISTRSSSNSSGTQSDDSIRAYNGRYKVMKKLRYSEHTTIGHRMLVEKQYQYRLDYEGYCNALLSNDTNVVVIDVDVVGITRTLHEIYQLGNAIQRNTTIRYLNLHIGKIEHYLRNFSNIKNNMNNMNNMQNCTFNHGNHTNTEGYNYSDDCLDIDCTMNTTTMINSFYDAIAMNPSLRNVSLKNSRIDRSYSIISRMLYATSLNRYIQTLYLCSVNIPIEQLSLILSSRKTSLRTIVIDDCDFFSTYNNNVTQIQHINQETEDDDDIITDNEDNEENKLILETLLASAFASNKTLQNVTLYRINEAYMNAIIVQLRSNNNLQSLSLSLPGLGISLGSIEGSITYTPTRGWTNSICNVLLSSCNNTRLRIIHLYSIQLDETTFCHLSVGIQNSPTVDTILLEYCRYVVSTSITNTGINTNYGGGNRIQEEFQKMFTCSNKQLYNNETDTSILLSEAKPIHAAKRIPTRNSDMALIIRQTSFYTKNNPLFHSLSNILSIRTCALRYLTCTSLSEQDFVSLMESLRINTTLQVLNIEFNIVEHESPTDIVRCTALMETIPKIHYLKVLTIGVGVGIDNILKNKLLSSFRRNSSLYKVDVRYLGARPFYDDPNDSYQLKCYQKRNKYLPELLWKLLHPYDSNNIRTTSETDRRKMEIYDNIVPIDVDDIKEHLEHTYCPSLGLVPYLLEATIGWEKGVLDVFHVVMNLNI